MNYGYGNNYQYGGQYNQGLIWVQGETGAKAYMVSPGNTLLLMDSEQSRFYIKATDQAGMPLPLRTFEYKEIQQAVQGPGGAFMAVDSKTPTREEYEALERKIEGLEKALEEMKQHE